MKESDRIKALLNSQEGEIGSRAQLFIELSAATQKIAELEAELELERRKSAWLAWAEEEVKAKNESAGTADSAGADSERPAGHDEGRKR